MGELEMIDENGVRASFTDQGVVVDLVPDYELCAVCNDARLLSLGDWVVCYRCGHRQ